MKNNLSCSEITKQKIAGALKELMETTNFEKITVSDITDRCGIHRQTFYYHFQDRYELLDWLLYNELLEPLTNGFTLDNMYEKFYNTFQTMSESKKFYQSALKINANDLSGYISRISTQQFSEVIKNVGIRNGLQSDPSEELILSEFFGYGISGIVLNWAHRGMKETPAEMTKKLESIVNVVKRLVENRK